MKIFDPMLRHKAWCLCRVCGEYFANIDVFDSHRAGGYCTDMTVLPSRFMQLESGHWQLSRVYARQKQQSSHDLKLPASTLQGMRIERLKQAREARKRAPKCPLKVCR